MRAAWGRKGSGGRGGGAYRRRGAGSSRGRTARLRTRRGGRVGWSVAAADGGRGSEGLGAGRGWPKTNRIRGDLGHAVPYGPSIDAIGRLAISASLPAPVRILIISVVSGARRLKSSAPPPPPFSLANPTEALLPLNTSPKSAGRRNKAFPGKPPWTGLVSPNLSCEKPRFGSI
jgi:hypothetical protein